jgi:hypothetical protein
MSTTHHNGSITLKSLTELGSVLDPQTLASSPSVSPDAEPSPDSASAASAPQPHELAGLIAQLASVSSGLERMARQDARAREQATIELAQHEALVAERQEAERALAEAHRLRAAAEQMAADAFTDEARAQAAQHAALARAAELACTQLLAERTRAAEELASRPHLARALSQRRRAAQQQAEAAQRAQAERTTRLASGLAAVHEALAADRLDAAERLLEPLVREFPDDHDVHKQVDIVRWRSRQRQVGPAEATLRDVLSRPYRDDPEAAVTRLAEVDMDGLPDDLARRLFGLWSNTCYRVVQQRGWHQPRRHAPFTSRGMIFARPTPDEPNTTVSALGMPDWRPGDIVTDQRVLRASRPLESR